MNEASINKGSLNNDATSKELDPSFKDLSMIE